MPLGRATTVNLLLVDDRPDGLLALEAVLRNPEYRFITANSGEEALRWLLENDEEIAVILMDVQMPGMDGFETAALVKTQEKYRHVPVIFVTGIHADPRFVSQGYELGAIDYVTKPFQPNILRSKVAVLVELHRKTKLLREMQESEHRRVLAAQRRDLEQAFYEKERLLISLVENSTDFIAMADPDLRVRYLNKAGRELVGLPSEAEACARTIPDFFVEGDRLKVEDEVLPKLRDLGEWEDELSFQHFQESRAIPVWSRAFAMRNPETGEIESIGTVTRDMSRQKADERAIRNSESRFRTFASNAPVGIYVTDSAGGCQYVNQRWQELAHMSEQEACANGGAGWLESLFPADRDRVLAEWQKSVDHQAPFHSEFRFGKTGGAVTWVQSRTSILYDEHGKPSGFIGSCVDVTERVKSEQTLRDAAEALTRSNAELQRFAWVASHDLKEPLRMVSSYMRLLERRYKGKIDAEADKYIQYAVDGACRMYSLVDGILAFSGVDRCAQPTRPVDANPIFDAAVSSLQVAIQENQALVQRKELPRLAVDPAQLGQLFQNLVANAIKFRRSVIPTVDVAAVRDGNNWVFTFTDNGIGIESRFYDKIFFVFERLHTKDQYPGSGVGLAICKKIVEKHGGRIWVESTPGVGSKFSVSFPATLAEHHPVPKVEVPPPSESFEEETTPAGT